MASYIMAHPPLKCARACIPNPRPLRHNPCRAVLQLPPWPILDPPDCIGSRRLGRSRRTCILMNSECCWAHRTFRFFIDPRKFRLPHVPGSGLGGEP
jgi:hypothetical protein